MARSKTIGFDSMHNDSEEAGNLPQVHGNFRWAKNRAKRAIASLQISSFLHGKKVTTKLRDLRVYMRSAMIGRGEKKPLYKTKIIKSSL
ncbi:hypothetical protein CDAR_418541 [Caerostris darwini]|uniref:Uncharacterized protein n=1 Tax=Caerostris darwini TaxID=1538125 RepID=A0AAV4MV11_9ARAC|nr:hypothetical protein CDAR_418541 [Caerostris darwini]